MAPGEAKASAFEGTYADSYGIGTPGVPECKGDALDSVIIVLWAWTGGSVSPGVAIAKIAWLKQSSVRESAGEPSSASSG